MIHGGDELQRGLNVLADQGARVGWYSQVSWLTAGQARRDRTVEYFGQTSRDPVRLLRGWLENDPRVSTNERFVTRNGRRTIESTPYAPSAANVQRIQSLYTREHRRSRVGSLRKRFGNGATVEIHAAQEIVDQSNRKIRAVVAVWVDDWDMIITHWERDDLLGLRSDWEAIASELYPPTAYVDVDHLGFG